MIDDKLNPLPDDIASLLGDVKGAPPPPAAARDRVSKRLSASLGISMIGAGVAAELLAEGATELIGEAAAQGAGAAASATVASSAGGKAGVAAAGTLAAKGAATAGAATAAAGSVTTAAATTVAATTTAAATAGAATAGAATAGAATAAASATSAAGTAGLFALFAKPALIGTFVAGTMVGGTTVAVVEPEIISAPPKVVYVAKDDPRLDRPVVDTKADTPPEAEAPAPVVAPPKSKPVRTKRADKKTLSKRASATADADKQLSRERALIEIARTALSRGQPGAALNSLKTHERRFPAGRLVEEREGLRVLALVGQGNKREAQQRAKRFTKRYPRSLLNAAIKNALAR